MDDELSPQTVEEILAVEEDPDHIWKGHIATLYCTVSVYLTETPTYCQLFILCEPDIHTDTSIEGMQVAITKQRLKQIISKDKLVEFIEQTYLTFEVNTRNAYGITKQ